MSPHPRHDLDETIHAPVRLSIMAALAAADRLHFGYLRDDLAVSDSLLSKHLTTLETAGYVRVDKGVVGRRPRTWVRLTEEGRRAFADYVATLTRIVGADPDRGSGDDASASLYI